MPICGSCGEDNPSRARFCLACATPLQEEPVTRDTRKVITILFADVVGSTELAERLDAELFREVMTRYFEEMRAVLVRHGGRVEKFIGDAVMAAFGVPVLHEDDALRAVRSALQMRESVEHLNAELLERLGVSIRLRIGVNTGEVLAGSTDGNQGLLAGDAVIHAARLEQIAHPGEILLGDATYKLVKDLVDIERTEARSVKGKSDQVMCHSVSGLRLEHAPARTVQAPLVGRARELEKMRSLFNESVGDQTCKVITVSGWPGIGKSRLVAEFLGSVDARARVVTGRCLSYGQGITFWPVLEVVKQLAGVGGDATPEESLARLRDVVRGDERAEAITAHVAQIIGLSATTTPFPETYWALRALLERVATTMPLIVVFEDIHWGEPTFLDLVGYLGRSIHSAPVLLVCTTRPELFDTRPDWGEQVGGAETLDLDRLADEDAGALVETMFGAPLPRSLVAAIEQAAEGNPLYIEQMVGSLKDTGYLPGEDPGEGATVAVPPTVNALIAARLDRLDDIERTLMEGASVIGKEFSVTTLVEICGDDLGAELGSHLDGLVRKQMLKPGRHGWNEYRFQHNLIRETTYNALPKGKRGELHEKVARAMERAPGSYLAQFEEITGYHLEQASRYFTEMQPQAERSRAISREAGRRLASAGHRAFARDDTLSAINLLERACLLLDPHDPVRLGCMPELAEALKESGDFDATRQVLDEVMTALGTEGDLGLRSRAQLVALDLDFRIDPRKKTAEGREQLRALIEALESANDDQGLAKAWNLLGHLSWWRGQFVAMAEASLNAIDRARQCDDDREEAWGHSGLAISTAMGPAPVTEGIRTCEKILDTLKQNRMVEARTLMALSLLRAWQGEFASARSAVEQARLIHEDMGLKMRAATDLPQLAGAIELLAGNAAAAEDVLRRGQEIIEQMGEKVYVPVLRVRLAQAVYAQGRHAEAEALTAEVVESAEADSVFLQVWGRTMHAKVLARRGELERAQAIAQEAVAITEGTDHLSMQADALVDLAEVYLLGSRDPQAIDPLARALALYERKGNLVGANTARLLLELGGTEAPTGSLEGS